MMAIEETVSAINFKALGRIVSALDRAQRILLFGIGASQFVARTFTTSCSVSAGTLF